MQHACTRHDVLSRIESRFDDSAEVEAQQKWLAYVFVGIMLQLGLVAHFLFGVIPMTSLDLAISLILSPVLLVAAMRHLWRYAQLRHDTRGG